MFPSSVPETPVGILPVGKASGFTLGGVRIGVWPLGVVTRRVFLKPCFNRLGWTLGGAKAAILRGALTWV